jgi:hypothetical protein
VFIRRSRNCHIFSPGFSCVPAQGRKTETALALLKRESHLIERDADYFEALEDQSLWLQKRVSELSGLCASTETPRGRHWLKQSIISLRRRAASGTPKQDEPIEVVFDLFPKSRFVPLCEVLATISRVTGFLSPFTHIQHTHVREKPENRLFYAGITGLGCNITIPKLAQISKHISQSALERTVLTYFSYEALLQANDIILTFAKRGRERDALLLQIRHSSMACWEHINMLGEYDFSDERVNTITGFDFPKILALEVV